MEGSREKKCGVRQEMAAAKWAFDFLFEFVGMCLVTVNGPENQRILCL